MMGIVGLLKSRKGTLSLLILALSGVALFMHRLGDGAFAGIVATVATIYTTTHAYQQTQSPRSP